MCYTFVCPLGDKNLFFPRGQTFSIHKGGEPTFVQTVEDKHFSTWGGQKLVHHWGDKHFTLCGRQIFSVGGGGRDYDVDGVEEEDVSKASKLCIRKE